MSTNNVADDVKVAARTALAKAKALDVCPFDSDVTIRVGDLDAERHAHALATTTLKSNGTMWKRDEVDVGDQTTA
jgi:hypothetical protein